MLALVAQIPSSRFSCAHQITNGLMDLVWHPDRRQFARSEQTRQGDRVAPVGFYAIARAFWYERGRDHITGMAEGSDLAIELIPGRAGLIADVQDLVLALQLSQEPLNGCRRSLDLAEKRLFRNHPFPKPCEAIFWTGRCEVFGSDRPFLNSLPDRSFAARIAIF